MVEPMRRRSEGSLAAWLVRRLIPIVPVIVGLQGKL